MVGGRTRLRSRCQDSGARTITAATLPANDTNGPPIVGANPLTITASPPPSAAARRSRRQRRFTPASSSTAPPAQLHDHRQRHDQRRRRSENAAATSDAHDHAVNDPPSSPRVRARRPSPKAITSTRLRLSSIRRARSPRSDHATLAARVASRVLRGERNGWRSATPARFTAANDAAPAPGVGGRRRARPMAAGPCARYLHNTSTHEQRTRTISFSFTTAPPRAPPRPSPCRSLRPTTRRSPRPARGRPRSRRQLRASRRPLSSSRVHLRSRSPTLARHRGDVPPTWRLRKRARVCQHRHDYRQLRGADGVPRSTARPQRWRSGRRAAPTHVYNSSDTRAKPHARFGVVSTMAWKTAPCREDVSVPQ